MTKITLKNFVDRDFKKSSEGLFFLKTRIKSAIVDIKIEKGKNEKIAFEYLSENDCKNFKIVNALADSILLEWKE